MTPENYRLERIRKNFAVIAKKALPFMDLDGDYLSDLIVDADNADYREPGDIWYLMVRRYGTNTFDRAADAIDHCGPTCDGRAVLRLWKRSNSDLSVTVHYKREDQNAAS